MQRENKQPALVQIAERESQQVWCGNKTCTWYADGRMEHAKGCRTNQEVRAACIATAKHALEMVARMASDSWDDGEEHAKAIRELIVGAW